MRNNLFLYIKKGKMKKYNSFYFIIYMTLSERG